MREVTVDEADELLDGERIVIDVRTPAEFAEGHLAGAVLLDSADPASIGRIRSLDRDVAYLVYCRSGRRSGDVRQLMHDLAFRDVADLAGGVVAWAAAGMPLEH